MVYSLVLSSSFFSFQDSSSLYFIYHIRSDDSGFSQNSMVKTISFFHSSLIRPFVLSDSICLLFRTISFLWFFVLTREFIILFLYLVFINSPIRNNKYLHINMKHRFRLDDAYMAANYYIKKRVQGSLDYMNKSYSKQIHTIIDKNKGRRRGRAP